MTMNMNLKSTNRTLLIFALLLCLTQARDAIGQGSESGLLDRSVDQFSIERGSVIWVLSNAAQTFDVPIGFEGARDADAGPEISVEIKGGTVRDLLNSVIRQDPRYEWRVVDGVINVLPKTDRDDLLASLLTTPVRGFHINEGMGRQVIKKRITELPEVKAKLESAGVVPTTFVVSNLDVMPIGSKFSLDVSDTTVRGLLNRLIRESRAKFWIIRRGSANGDDLILNF